MKGKEPSEETVTRTFRVNKEWDQVLNEEAQWMGISVSALLDHIVRRYVVVERFQRNSPVISMDNKLFTQLLQSVNEDDLKHEGLLAGNSFPEEELLKRGVTKSFESYMWIMKEVYGRYYGWFNVDHYTTEEQTVLHLRHHLNQKWSKYLSYYFSTMFKSNLELEIETEIREESATLYLSNKQIKSQSRVP